MIKSVLPLSLIIALRFFGLFLVLPVISVYAMNLEGSTPMLVGIVIGGYALTQMIFQVPFGMISDKIGRKKTIVIGIIMMSISYSFGFLFKTYSPLINVVFAFTDAHDGLVTQGGRRHTPDPRCAHANTQSSPSAHTRPSCIKCARCIPMLRRSAHAIHGSATPGG